MSKKHKAILITLRVIGLTFLIGGLGLFIFGIVDFFSHFNTQDMPEHPWALFVAMPALFIGMVCTTFGFRSKVAKFIAQDTREVRKDVVKDMASAALKGIKGIKVCPNCGEVNDEENKYCEHCGKLIARKTCPNCGESVDHYSRYCPTCGHEMEK